MNDLLTLHSLKWRDWFFFRLLLREPTVVEEQPFNQTLSLSSLIRLFFRCLSGRQSMVMSKLMMLGSTRVGLLLLDEYDAIDQRAVISFDVHPNFRGRSLATIGIKQFCKEAFESAAVNRIDAFVRLGHKRSYHALLNAGFVDEGVLRQYTYFKGQFIDVHILRRCRDES